jgi:hypothetical protein
MLAYEWQVFLPKSPGYRELRPKYRPGLKELIPQSIMFCITTAQVYYSSFLVFYYDL